MAFTASTIWEVETGGDDTNFGGGFDTGVAGFPTDGAVASSNTSAPVFSSASYNFTSADVTTPPAWVYMKSGTSLIAGWYKITSLSGNAAVLDAAIGHAVLANGTPNTVVGCCTTGTSLSTITWGVDYSQSTAARINLDDMVVGGTTTQFTSVHTPVAKNFIGNIISVTSGATVQRVAIISTVTTTATCDKTLGTAAQVGVGKLGGCFASPGAAAAVRIATNTVWIQSGTYTISNTSSNTSGGPIADSTANAGCKAWEGYGTVRGDLGTAPLLQVASSGVTAITIFSSSGGSGYTIRNITVDGASKATILGFSLRRDCSYFLLTAKNCTNQGFSATGGGILMVKCIATGCTTTSPAMALGTGCYVLCEAYSNTVTGMSGTAMCAFFCLSYGNTGATSDGFASGYFVNCSAYGNGRDGFRLNNATDNSCINCLAENSTGFGFSVGGASNKISALVNCGGFNNTLGNYDTTNFLAPVIAFVNAVSSLFVNASSGNFALNNTSGAGAAARATGIPGVFLSGTTTGYQDIGAAQHADPVVTIATRANPLGGFIS